MKSKFLILMVCCWIMATNVFGKDDSLQSQPLLKNPKVIKAIQLKNGKAEAALGDYIKVTVTNIDSLVRTSTKYNRSPLLYFNDIPMHGIYAEFISARDSSIIFKLTRDTASLKAWNVFYQSKLIDIHRPVTISVGVENVITADSDVNNFTLILARKHHIYIATIGILLTLSLFIILVKKTGIIRDDSFEENKGVYSLARTQLAFWTFIIIISFIYIWIVTGEIPPVTGSTLVLLTISMATTAGSKIIDSSKDRTPEPQDAISDGFLKDIISDYSGVSIHRFQMVIWTIVLGVFFLRSVFKDLSMPQFDDSLLMLMGISSGTFLGLKIPEKGPGSMDTEVIKKEEEDNNDTLDETPAVG